MFAPSLTATVSRVFQSDGRVAVCRRERPRHGAQRARLQRGIRGGHVLRPLQGGQGICHQAAGGGPAVRSSPLTLPFGSGCGGLFFRLE